MTEERLVQLRAWLDGTGPQREWVAKSGPDLAADFFRLQTERDKRLNVAGE